VLPPPERNAVPSHKTKYHENTFYYVIYDQTGRMIIEKTEFSSNFRIGINTLSPGLYVFNLNGETRKLVVK
jgi:outer membrane protein assembly factor BamE (lipoprotein component of BamABCDE complex)